VDRNTPAHAVAREEVARANRLSLRTINSWEDQYKPFGWIGLALGIQDREGR
jgi:hypothetical protein